MSRLSVSKIISSSSLNYGFLIEVWSVLLRFEIKPKLDNLIKELKMKVMQELDDGSHYEKLERDYPQEWSDFYLDIYDKSLIRNFKR